MYSPLQFSLQSVRCKAHILKLWRGTESRQCLANVLPHQAAGCYIGAESKTTCAAKQTETEEFTIAFAKLAEGNVDILQVRGGDGDESRPTTFNSTSTPVTLAVAEAVKKSGAKIVVAPIGGFEDPDLAEQWLAEGKMDLMAAGRAFVCEPDYVKKLHEDRGEDIVPCIPRRRRPSNITAAHRSFILPETVRGTEKAPCRRPCAAPTGLPCRFKRENVNSTAIREFLL